MKKRIFASHLVLLIIAAFFISGAKTPRDLQAKKAANQPQTYPVMHPDSETLQKWIQDYQSAPPVNIDQELKAAALPSSHSVLPLLNYIPEERDQVNCGNCWVWAGTGIMEIALKVKNNISDRYSIQYFTSCFSNWFACCGGWLSDFRSFYQYNSHPAIPWNNSNASWQDFNTSCGAGSSVVPCGTIATNPHYGIVSISEKTIPTIGVGQEQAIENIKNVLLKNQAIFFAFFLPNGDRWNEFFNFWYNEPENVTWNAGFSCGEIYDQILGGGGHAVLCVGYIDDGSTRYWIMLNSWGVGPSNNRPGGLFLVDMRLDYDSFLYIKNTDQTFKNLMWQTLDVVYDFSNPDDPLGAPSNLKVWGEGLQVKMTWQDNSTQETKFRIHRMDSKNPEFSVVGEVGPNITSYTDTNYPDPLNGGHTECWYRVRALGENGKASDFSNEAYVKMYVSAPEKAPALTFPIGNIDQIRPTFTWNRVQRAASYYIAVRKDPGENYFIIDPPDVTGTSYQCPVNLKNCQRYYWKVKACNNMGCGEYSGGYFTPSMSCAAVSINDANVMEGNSGTTNLSVNVQLAESNSLAVTVDYATKDGTAKAGVDYGSVSGTLTFPPGTTTQSIIVPVSGDTVFEGDETFLIQLSNPVQATIVDGEGMVTITNDDPKPAVRFSSPAVFSAEEGSNIVFTAVIEGDFEIPLDYYWRACPGTATPGEDFDPGSPVNQIIAPVGTREISFMVRAFADMAVEPTEFFMAAIGPNDQVSCEGQLAQAEIIDKIGLAINDVSVSEKAGTAVFTVTMSKPGTSGVLVNYATAPMTAIAPGDYTAVSGTLTIPAGSTSATIQVPIIDDSIRENDEQFAVRLSDAVNAAITDSEGVGTIIDDDIQVPKISIDSVTLAEGNSGTTPFTFTVTLSLPATWPVTVKYATANGTALAGSDYITASGTLSFAPGEVSKTLVVKVIGDRVRERDEGFFVNLSNPTGAELYVKSGRGFITNDD